MGGFANAFLDVAGWKRAIASRPKWKDTNATKTNSTKKNAKRLVAAVSELSSVVVLLAVVVLVTTTTTVVVLAFRLLPVGIIFSPV